MFWEQPTRHYWCATKFGNKYFESLKISFKLKPEIHKKTKKVFIIIFFKMGFPSVYLSIGFKVFVFGLIVSTAFYVPTTICHLINVGFYCVNVCSSYGACMRKLFFCVLSMCTYMFEEMSEWVEFIWCSYCDIFAAANVPKKRKYSSIISFVMPCISKHALSICICV